ncbi:ComF family protein [Halobacillus kuroshimensis]|nr:phosphoribosyltransferase family protein [Halobacillus kuroshimensis]
MNCYLCFSPIVPEVNWTNFLLPAIEKKICRTCEEELEELPAERCPMCSRPGEGLCGDCARWEETLPGVLDQNDSVFTYNAFAKELVAKWKYRGDYVAVEALETFIKEKWNVLNLNDYLTVCVPLSSERERERGFNQSGKIIEMVGKEPAHLFKRIHGEKQSKRNRRARLEAENPFSLVKLVDQPVIIVDDIYTTGRTIRHMASLLKENGCPAVRSFTIFR